MKHCRWPQMADGGQDDAEHEPLVGGAGRAAQRQKARCSARRVAAVAGSIAAAILGWRALVREVDCVNLPTPRWPANALALAPPDSCDTATVSARVLPGGIQPRCGCMPEGVSKIAIRMRHTGRFLSTFPSGGEVYAIGAPGRMRLAHMTFDATVERSRSVWFSLRHSGSNSTLVMLPPDATDGSWTLRLMRPEAAEAAAGTLGLFGFCVEPEDALNGSARLFAAAAAGFVNVRDGVLLRGHGDPERRRGQRPAPAPASRLSTTRLELFGVSVADLEADARASKCRAAHPSIRQPGVLGLGGAQSGSGGAPGVGFRGQRLHVLTYATKISPMMCDAVLVALAAGVRLNVLGWREEYLGNFQKLRAARAYAASVPPGDVLLFGDAYDVLWLGGERALMERFNSLSVPPSGVLFQAELGCWPDSELPFGRDFCTREYPPSPTPYRFVNSGVWAGTAAAAHALLTDLLAFTPGIDDQQVVAHHFVAQPDRFMLDYHSHLFQSMHGAMPAATAGNSAPAPVVRITGSRPCGRTGGRRCVVAANALTGTAPLLLHFNGGAKPLFPASVAEVLGQLLAPHAGRRPCLEERVRNASGHTLPFADLCPGHFGRPATGALLTKLGVANASDLWCAGTRDR